MASTMVAAEHKAQSSPCGPEGKEGNAMGQNSLSVRTGEGSGEPAGEATRTEQNGSQKYSCDIHF